MSSYLRITPFTLEVSLVRPRLAVLVALGALACGSPGPDKVAPQSPQQTLTQFMSAVKANDISRMGTLWGSDRGLRMDERDAPAAGAPPRHFVHQTVSVRSAAFERTVEIRHTVAHVMDPRPARREESRDRPDRFTRLEELDVDVAQGQTDDRRTVRGLGASGLEAEDVPIEGEGGVDRWNGDADVRDPGG